MSKLVYVVHTKICTTENYPLYSIIMYMHESNTIITEHGLVKCEADLVKLMFS